MNYYKLIVTVVSITAISNQSFSQGACFSSANDNVYTGASNSHCLTKGDFDNDGDLDVVQGNFTGTANASLDRLYFLENNGDATFQAPVSIVSGSRPKDVKAADFDNDGNLDLAVVNNNLATLGILLGNGDGTFQSPVTYATGALPNRIAIADFNNDGEEDIAITTVDNFNTVQVFLANTGSLGTFNAPISTGMFGAAPYGLYAADFDNDGNMDVVTANSSTDNASVLLGDGTGNFAAPVNYATDLSCNAVVATDLDDDGFIDFVTANEDADNISVLMNDGTGTFDPAVNYAAGDRSINLDFSDINNDTEEDIVVVNTDDNTLSTFISNGDGTLQPQAVVNSIGSPYSLITGDFNSDSNTDIVVSCLVGQVMPVYIGDGSGTFSLGTSVPVGNAPTELASADFNLDGNMDFVVVNSADNNAQVYIGNGGAGYTLQNTLTTGNNPTAVSVADLDGNGSDDIIVTNYGDGDVSVFMNTSGLFTAATNYPCNANPIDIAAGDINNDGDPDIAVLNEANQVSVMEGNGTGGFSAATTYVTGNTPTGIDLGDANGDGFDDMVVANGADNDIRYYQNDGTGDLTTNTDRNVGTNPSSVTFGDLTNDGAPEIVTTNYGSNNISVTINNGSGLFGFGSTTYTSSDTGPQDAVIEDFDGDGNNDVMVVYEVSSASTGYAGLFMGDGSGALNFFQRFSTGMNPLGIVSADFNNDSKLDVAVVNNISNSVTVLYNATATASALGATTFCDGNSVDLQASSSSSYLWSNSATTQTITVTTSGSYTVQTTEGQSGWCTSTSAPINVTVNPLPTVTVSGTTTICNGESTTLTASGASTYSWDSGLGAGDTKNVSPTSNSSYVVTGTDANGCQDSETVSITVNALPDASFTGLAPDYCVNDASATLAPVVSGGNFTGTGVSASSFDPAVALAGTHEVKYIITDGNGCTDSTSQSTTVNALPDASFTGLNAQYCEDATTVSLNPATGGGSFSGPGISGSNFDPTAANLGSNTIQYTVTDGNGCTDQTTQNVTINSLPDATFNTLDPSYCQDGNTVSLVPIQSGGTFSGSGVSGSTFDPSTATTGSVTITYNIADGNGCSNSSVQSTTVNPLPDPSFSGLNSDYCEDASSVLITPSQSGGTFSGTGVSSNVFNPQLANIGTNEVKYIITDGNGCTDSSSFVVTVNSLPNTSFTGLLPEYCQSDDPTNLVPSQSGGVFVGPGVSSGQFDPSQATPGSVNVSYSITDGNGCFNSTTESTTVYALPDASFNTLNAQYCEDEAAVNLVPNQTGGTFSGGGVSGTQFDPASATIGNNDIKYVITDVNGCSDSTTQSVTVNALPDSVFTGLGTQYCQNDPAVTLTPNETGGTFSGSGIVNGNEFNPILASVGMNTIQYTITNAQNCTASSSETVEILPLPDNTITVNSLTLSANELGPGFSYQWIDCENGNAAIADANDPVYEVTENGSYAVVVSNGSCSDTSACEVIDYVGLKANKKTLKLTIYPNPSNGQFVIQLSESCSIKIFNALGQQVYHNTLNKGESTIVLNYMNAGVYMVQFETAKGDLELRRVVIED